MLDHHVTHTIFNYFIQRQTINRKAFQPDFILLKSNVNAKITPPQYIAEWFH